MEIDEAGKMGHLAITSLYRPLSVYDTYYEVQVRSIIYDITHRHQHSLPGDPNADRNTEMRYGTSIEHTALTAVRQ